MMKKFIAPLMVGATLATGLVADDSLKAEIEALKAQMAELKKAQESINIDALSAQLSEVKAHSAGDNIKWDIDFRTAYDMIEHKTTAGYVPSFTMAGGLPGMFTPVGGEARTEKNAIWTNKLILGMAAQPVENLVFKGSLGFYKAFGQSNIGSTSMFQDFDWYINQKPQADNSIRLREAYFLYFGQAGDMKYTASFGRRPSTDGFMINLREDNVYPASPVGHNINMEFDGASFKFDFDKLTGIPGLYFKLCLGRGFSNTLGAYSMSTNATFNTSYADDGENPDMDLAGLLIQAYDDGQYKVMANVFQGWNMMGMGMDITVNTGDMSFTMAPNGFHDVGDMAGASLSLQVNGIGNEINDFLDDTVAFASYAMMKTDPNNNAVNNFLAANPANQAALDAMLGGMLGGLTPAELANLQGAGMLGSQDKETGYSYYVGVNMPGFMESDRIGLEYNHGSKYWRSFTYGEDTLAGSKLATRGDAYEIYYTLPLVAKNLTAQIRATYFDYKYAGSDTFFGQTGNPAGMMGVMPYVEEATNIRFALRYRY